MHIPDNKVWGDLTQTSAGQREGRELGLFLSQGNWTLLQLLLGPTGRNPLNSDLHVLLKHWPHEWRAEAREPFPLMTLSKFSKSCVI